MNYNQANAEKNEKIKIWSKSIVERSIEEARKAKEDQQKYKKIAEETFEYAKNNKHVKEGILWGYNWEC